VTVLSGQIVLSDRIVSGELTIDGDRIVGLTETADAGAELILPGLVDIHVHGGGGGSFIGGSAASARTAAGYHHSRGTTSMLGSLVSAAPESLLRDLDVLSRLTDEGVLAGIHLEGPFLSAARCGAHDPAVLRDPDAALVGALIEAGRGHLRQVTIAPERTGALEAIGQLRSAGVVAAVGHTDGSYQQSAAAYRAGASLTTHLFNGMRPLHHRDPGPVAAALATAGVVCELIGDGAHVDDHTMATVFALLGAERVALITDAMQAAGIGDGHYDLGGLAVDVHDGVARLADGGAIAGGTATLLDVVRRAVGVGVPLADAVRAASLTPARAVGLAGVGSLAIGLRADVLVLSPALQLRTVIRAGQLVEAPAK
jgi:N-acetylglucosamine-6-phosphate deacetylase